MKPWFLSAVVVLGILLILKTSIAPTANDIATTAQSVQCDLWVDGTSPVLSVDLGISQELDRPKVNLYIPENYILQRDRARYRQGALDGAALIHAKLPDFGPQTPKIEVDPASEDFKATASILITTNVDLETILASKIRIWGRAEEGQTFPYQEAGPGLLKVDYPIYGTPAFETFFAKAGDEVSDVMVCDNRPQSAQCQHLFDAGLVEVSVTYNRTNLSRWSHIRSSAQTLLDCVMAPNEPNDQPK